MVSAMAAGVTMLDPETVWLSNDTKLSADVTLGPNVRFGPGVSVASGARINAFCDIEGARIGKGAIIGPFARIRPGSDLADDVHLVCWLAINPGGGTIAEQIGELPLGDRL